MFCLQLSPSPPSLSVLINVHTCVIFYDRSHLLKQRCCPVSDMPPHIYVIKPCGGSGKQLLLQTFPPAALPRLLSLTPVVGVTRLQTHQARGHSSAWMCSGSFPVPTSSGHLSRLSTKAGVKPFGAPQPPRQTDCRLLHTHIVLPITGLC